MATHIAKIGDAGRNAQTRFSRDPGLVVTVLAAIAVTTSSFTACAQDPANPQPIARVMASPGASEATGPAAAERRTLSRAGENHQLFFGFLEFDWDPNASGGVPGFGPLPDPTQFAKR